MESRNLVRDFLSASLFRSAHYNVTEEVKAFETAFEAAFKEVDLAKTFDAVSSVIWNGVVGRVHSIGAAVLCICDFATQSAIIRPFTSLTILFDSGITLESVTRAVASTSVIILKGALRCATAALSILFPELFLGCFRLHEAITVLDTFSIGLRLNLEESGIGQSGASGLNEQVDVWGRWSFRTNFAFECANVIRADGDRATRYKTSISSALNHLGYYLSSANAVYPINAVHEPLARVIEPSIPSESTRVINQLLALFRQRHGLNHSRNIEEERELRNQRGSELAATPFCSEFLKEIESEGNLLIDQGLYTRDDIEDFSKGYQAVCNRAIFKTLIHLFDCSEEGDLIYRESGAEVAEEEVIDQIGPHLDSIRKVVLNYKELSKHIAQAKETVIDEVQAAIDKQLLWQLCFDQDDILKKLDYTREEFDPFKEDLDHSPFAADAVRNVKEILLIIPGLRIELIEKSLLNASELRRSSISQQFQAACARLKDAPAQAV